MHPLRDNPFFVLELPPTATPMEIERQGKKLLAMLDLALGKSLTFPTPYGPQPRTPERIREAVQLLLDPARRLPFEPWAAATFPSSSSSSSSSSPEPLPLAAGAAPATESTSAALVDAGSLVWWRP